MSETEGNIERWPAEWELHARTWIAWPHQRDDWPGKFGPIPWVYAEIVRHLHRSEEVGILGPNWTTESQRCGQDRPITLVTSAQTFFGLTFELSVKFAINWLNDLFQVFQRR